MKQIIPRKTSETGDEGDWLRVEGRSRGCHPLYTTAMRILGEAAYRLVAIERRSGLVAYDIIVPGQLSRSGQPRDPGWQYLRARGVRTIVNLRLEDDGARRLRDLGFTGYLHMPIPDGLPPTDRQAIAFLRFVRDPAHRPAHLHCLSGVQRSGIISALIWHAVEGLPAEAALRRASRHLPGPTALQRRWLRRWAERHGPAEWRWGEDIGQ